MLFGTRFTVLLTICLTSSSSLGLTLSKGEVLGNDGGVYKGASPEQLERLISKSESSGDSTGIFGQSVFVVVDDDAVFVPFSDLTGKTKETVKAVVSASLVAKVVEDATDIKLEIGDLAAEIKAADGDLEAAVSTLINGLSSQSELGLPELNETLTVRSQDQQILHQQIVSELMEKDVSIEAAVNSWASMSAAEKQNLVERANNAGALGCTACTIADAEQFIEDITQNKIEVNFDKIGDGQEVLARLAEPDTTASLRAVTEEVTRQATESLSDKIDRIIGAAVAATHRTGDDIGQAILDWDAMPEVEKQALVDKLNQDGLLGCTECSIQDAEERANSLRQ